MMTTSDAARHTPAELETIAAGLQLNELARLVALARPLLEEPEGPEVEQRSPAATAPARLAWTTLIQGEAPDIRWLLAVGKCPQPGKRVRGVSPSRDDVAVACAMGITGS